MTNISRRVGSALLITILLAAGCSGTSTQRPPIEGAPELVAQVASYDIAKGREARFLVGLLTQDQEPIGGGSVKMRFSAIDGGAPDVTTVGRFLLIPDKDHEHAPGSEELPHGFGVYSTRVKFDVAGNWEVTVTPEQGDHKGKSGKAAFAVLEKNRVAVPGEPALPTENHVLGAPGVPPAAIDSRASETTPIPDPGLHSATIKQAIEANRPALVVFSTPTYCVSRFCGPVTEMVEDLSKKYPDKAVYIHIEIWRDRQANAINKAAADWLFRDEDLQEPWVFLIGADGVIKERWDNVATAEEIEPLLRSL